MTTRHLTTTIYRADGTPWAGAKARFTLVVGSFTPDGQYPPSVVEAVANTSGVLTADLWCSTTGEIPTLYHCQLDGEPQPFALQVPPGAVTTLSALRAAGNPGTTSQQATLLSLVDAEAAARTAADALLQEQINASAGGAALFPGHASYEEGTVNNTLIALIDSKAEQDDTEITIDLVLWFENQLA